MQSDFNAKHFKRMHDASEGVRAGMAEFQKEQKARKKRGKK